MRARLPYSYSTFLSIFETDVNLSKCGHTQGRGADERHTPHYLFICYAVEDETDVAQVLFLFNMVRYLGLALCTTYSRVFKY